MHPFNDGVANKNPKSCLVKGYQMVEEYNKCFDREFIFCRKTSEKRSENDLR